MELNRELFKLCYNDNRFEGPASELRTGRCSQDIPFWGRNGEKICYEVDCQDFHDEENDKKRDYFLKKEFGWKVFRVDVRDIDTFGIESIAEMVYTHLLSELGHNTNGVVLPGIIISYNSN